MKLTYIPTVEEMATSHVRECYNRLVKRILDEINFTASRGGTSYVETIPTDYLEAIFKAFILKGYEVEYIGEAARDRINRNMVEFRWGEE